MSWLEFLFDTEYRGKVPAMRIDLLNPTRRVRCGSAQGGDWAFFTYGKCELRPRHKGRHEKTVGVTHEHLPGGRKVEIGREKVIW